MLIIILIIIEVNRSIYLILIFIHVFRIRWHVFIAIIFVCHIACCARITSPCIINCILILIHSTALHWCWICWCIIKTIIEHHYTSSLPRLSNCWYTSNFLLRMYWLIWAVMFHFIIVILTKSTRTLARYYHLLLHTCWRPNTITL